MKPFITINHLSYQYPQQVEGTTLILQDICLEIGEGELVAIIGQNGSGKTTLIRHLNGMLTPTTGIVLVSGLDTRNPAFARTIHQWVGMVFQNPNDQIVASVVEDDVAFGPENIGLPPAEIRQRVEETLQVTDLVDLRLRPPHLLSEGQIQRVALAGVLALRPRCIVFDEATAMLDPSGRRMVMQQIMTLHKQGVTIIYVTHSMEEAAMAGRIIVLHHGKVVIDGQPRSVFAPSTSLTNYGLELPPAVALAERLRRYIPTLGQALSAGGILSRTDLEKSIPAWDSTHPLPHGRQLPQQQEQTGETVIEVAALGHTYLAGTPLAHKALDGVDLKVWMGQIHGLIGATGSGKSTLLQHLNGILRPQTGSVRVGPYHLNDPKVSMRTVIRMVGLVFQNPEMQFFEQYVGDEIAFGPRQIQASEPLAQRVRWAMETVGLDFDLFKDRLLFTLSGGERRKVALASILALKPSILLLDEPTAGLDPASRRDLLSKLRSFQVEEETTIILSSHQMEDMVELAQGLTVFSQGKSVQSGSTSDILSNGKLLGEVGLEQPLAAQCAGWMRQREWDLPPGIISADQLEWSLSDGFPEGK